MSRFSDHLHASGLPSTFARDAIDRFPSVGDFVHAFTQAGPAPAKFARSELSVAVLPFSNLSAEPENEYFSDGITEDIITQVSKVSALKVISRTSVMQFKNTTQGLRTVAAALGVTNILKGSVRRSGNRLRITAQLIDANTDQHLWAETYDRLLTDVFEIQSDIAQAIAGALRAILSPAERSRLMSVDSVDLDTYNDTLLGRHHWHRWTEEGFHECIACVDRAIARNALYAPAHAWRGLAYGTLSLGYWSVAGGTFRNEAEESLHRALELDSTLGDAMGWSAYIAMQYDHDWEGAERILIRALEVNPNSASLHDVYGNLLAATGRHREAARELEIAVSLDPLSYFILANAGLCAHRAREFSKAAELFARQIALNPDLPMGHGLRALALAKAGRRAEAAEAGRKGAALYGVGAGDVLGAIAVAGAGLADEARLRISDVSSSASSRTSGSSGSRWRTRRSARAISLLHG